MSHLHTAFTGPADATLMEIESSLIKAETKLKEHRGRLIESQAEVNRWSTVCEGLRSILAKARGKADVPAEPKKRAPWTDWDVVFSNILFGISEEDRPSKAGIMDLIAKQNPALKRPTIEQAVYSAIRKDRIIWKFGKIYLPGQYESLKA